MDKDIATLLQRAVAAQRAGKGHDADALFTEVLRRAPEHPVALNALGANALNERRFADAQVLFSRAASADPGAADLWVNHAHASRLVGDFDAERVSLERALDIAPRSFVAAVRLAELHERMGAAALASARWSAVIELARAMGDPSPEAAKVIAHAERFVTAQSAGLARHLDAALAGIRGETATADRRRVDAAIDFTLGRRSIFLNQCSGLHVPFLPADEFFDPRLFPWFATLEAASGMIREELTASLGGEGFDPYVSLPGGVRSDTWDALNGSLDWSAQHLWRDGIRDDAACARFPRTAALLDTLPLAHLPQRMPTIFFSVLKGETHIPAHTGVTNARAIVHLPLIIPEGCRFRVGGETRAWRIGEAFAFDDTIEHEAWNDSDDVRVVLIMDAWNPHLTALERRMIDAFYVASEQSELAPGMSDRNGLS